MMRRFAQAAVVAAAISAPVFAGAMIDDSVVSVLGSPGTGQGCSSSCNVGGSAPGSPAQGGHSKISVSGMGSASMSGTAAAGGSTGRIVINNPTFAIGSASGNFTSVTAGTGPGKGHCTGALTGLCSTGP
jgi:hypothetical protein